MNSSLKLYQIKNSYCYNSDTYFLFDFIEKNLQKYKNIKGNILDVGSGSGIIGFLFKKYYPNIKLFSNEIQDDFLSLTKYNANINNIDTELIKGDFLKIDKKRFFDIIISNPPYYPSCVIKSKNKNLYISKYQDSLPLENFIKQVSVLLKDRGRVFFCYDEKEIFHISTFCSKFKINIETIRFLHPKIGKKASLVMVSGKKNSKTKPTILPPLVMFNEECFSDEVQNIYKKYKIDSVKTEKNNICTNCTN